MIYCFDIDGTVCTNTYGAYQDAKPITHVIERINVLVKLGHTVYLFAGRETQSGTNSIEFTRKQLKNWGVAYHTLFSSKPVADIYIDEKSVNISDWNLTPIFDEKLDTNSEIYDLSEVSCYLCGCNELEVIARETRRTLSEVWYCENCDLAMLDWQTQNNLEEYYNYLYRKEHGPDLNRQADYETIFQSQVGHQEARLNALKPYLSESSKVLEIGCSSGHFLYHVKKLVGEVVGVDYDKEAAKYAAEQCSCKTYSGDFNQIKFEPEYFDVVCTIQTLEHVQDPITFMRDLKKLVKKDGLIFVEVPNLYDPLITIYANKIYNKFYFHDAHIYYFSVKSLQAVMKKAGIVGKVEFVQDYNFLNHVHWQSSNKPQQSCDQGLGPNRLKISENCPESFRIEFDEMNERFDQEYKALLSRYEVTDNLAFFGHPS